MFCLGAEKYNTYKEKVETGRGGQVVQSVWSNSGRLLLEDHGSNPAQGYNIDHLIYK